MLKRIFGLILTVVFFSLAFPFSAIADTETINLAEGFSYIIQTTQPISHSYSLLMEGNEPFETNNGRLTDSNDANENAESNAWYRAYRGGGRIIRFDLGTEKAIFSVSAGFLYDSKRNIVPPRYIRVYLSDDGENYGLAGEYNAVYPLSFTDSQHCNIEITFNKTYSARFVNVEFSCDNYVYSDEISIWGSNTLSGTEEKVQIIQETEKEYSYPSEIMGVSDIIRLQAGGFSYEEALCCVGYLNTNGEIAGKMFGSASLSPASTIDFSDIKGWELYLLNLASSLKHLQNSANEVYSALGFQNKLKVFITLPLPPKSENPFGDINGDEIVESCFNLYERLEISKWFIAQCESLSISEEYKNLELCGFFFGAEEIDFNLSDHESALIKSVNEHITSKSLASIYESGYLACGYDLWKELGFSRGLMKPQCAKSVSDIDYYFDLAMLSEFSDTALKNGLGVALELDNTECFLEDGFLKAGKNYEAHLYYGYKKGYMNGLTSYSGYDNVFYTLCHGDINTPKGIYLRRLYDLTYNFIYRTYENLSPQISIDENHEFHLGDSGINIQIDITDGDSHWNDITIEFTSKPIHGSVVASSNKKELIYNADEGFVGEDRFSVRVYDGFGYSREAQVTILVKEAQLPPTPPVMDESSNPPLDNEESLENIHTSEIADYPILHNKKTPLWVYCTIAILIGSTIVLGIGILAKKRK